MKKEFITIRRHKSCKSNTRRSINWPTKTWRLCAIDWI